METVVLVIHPLLALSLIGVVLLQRSEGGGLGIGGGGGGTMSGRSAGTALGTLTWGLAVAFICTSIALTIIAASQGAGTSVIDRLSDQPVPDATAPATGLPSGEGLLPPGGGTSGGGGLLPDLE